MKTRLLLCCMLLVLSYFVSAQSWSQNFNTATPPSLPAGWGQNNIDGLTPPASLSSYSFAANAWVTHDFTATDATHGKAVISTSFYNPSGIANDWLISPSFPVPANAVLDWEGRALNPNFPDGYEVRISTTGTTVAAFSTTLMTVPAENLNWTARGLSLSAYAGQTVHLAFVNTSDDSYILALDNIKVWVPTANDGNLLSIGGLTRYVSSAGNQTVSGLVRSAGASTASGMVIHYNLNNGAVSTQSLSFPGGLSYGQSAAYSFTAPAAIQPGTNRIKVWVSAVNGVTETNRSNDTAYAYVYRSSAARPRNALVEEFSSSSCGPCAQMNPPFDTLLNIVNHANTGGHVNTVKYQVDWPAPPFDPSNNSHVNQRVAHYQIYSAPTTLANGRTPMYFHTQSEINTAIAEPAYADITASLTVTGSNVSGSATITPYVTVASPSPLRVHQVLAQHYYNYPGAFTTQKQYYNVMRKMFPDASGAAQTLTDGTALTVSFNHPVTISGSPAQMSYDFWTTPATVPLVYEYVVFIQDSVSNHVLQSASASFTVGSASTGLVNLEPGEALALYPNPAQDFAAIGTLQNTAAELDLRVVTMNGQLMYRKQARVEAGQHELLVDISTWPNGSYTVLLGNGKTMLWQTLVIAR